MTSLNVDQELDLLVTTGTPSIAVDQDLALVVTTVCTAIIAEPQIDAFPNPNLAATFIRFRLRGFAGSVPRVGGYPVTVTATTAVGSISQTLHSNSAIVPAGTFYTIELWSNGCITSSANYVINGSGDLSSMTPV
jgi:hypothetical protein